MLNAMKAKRKLFKIGGYTYIVTLPKEWVKELKWRSKQMVELQLRKDSIVVRDYKNS